MSVAQVDRRVAIVLDLKTSGSGESHWNDWNNPSAIFREDQIKFVICDDQDYVWVKVKMLEGNLVERAGGILFSPSFGQQIPKQLAQWNLDDQLVVRMQLQLQKNYGSRSPVDEQAKSEEYWR